MLEPALLTSEIEGMPWRAPIFPKQEEVLAACCPQRKRFILISGPRWASKSIAAEHAICQHLWNTENDNFLMLTITQSSGVDSGIWEEFTQVVIPQWIDGNFGFKWVREPWVNGTTKRHGCAVTNKFGGVSKVILDSLRDEKEVENKYKSKNYSGIFVNELSKFRKRKTFDTLLQSLRMQMRGIPEECHLFMADTNPADEGPESWIYKLWYELRVMTDEELDAKFPNVPPGTLRPLRDSLELIEFTIDDNLSLTDQKKAELFASFAHDDDLLQRYYYGKWVTASVDSCFYEVFNQNIHVKGELQTADNPEPDYIVPSEECAELSCGADLGTVNSAVAFGEMMKVPTIIKTKEGQREGLMTVFNQFDELVKIGDHKLGPFVEEWLQKLEKWEDYLERPIDKQVYWNYYSDRNVFEMKDLDGDIHLAQRVLELSGGRIKLIGAWDAQRGPGSVERRVDYLRRLLFEQRFYVSRTHCPRTIEMLKGLRRKKSGFGVVEHQPHKHPFDATTYWVCSDGYQEMNTLTMVNMRRERSGGGLIQVPG